MFSVVPFLKPGDPFVATESLELIEAIYRFKYHLAGLLRPRSILEVGVRAGYSAAAFLSACPEASYLGLDIDDTAHGGEPGYSRWAEGMLRSRFPRAAVSVLHLDTRSAQLPPGPFDLVHVDGDHTEEGCLYDLRQAVRVGRWVLVDDVAHIRAVAEAVRRFLAERPSVQAVSLPSPRGDCLVRCG